MAYADYDDEEGNKLSIPLVIGLLLFPVIFAFITLLPSYNKQTRIFAFSWLAFWIAANLVLTQL